MLKILVTGTNGLLGQKLIELILSKTEVRLVATSRGKERVKHLGDYVYQSLDLSDKEAVNKVVAEHQPDVIINTAAMTNVDQCETEHEECLVANVQTVKNLVEVCEKHKAFLVHLSTDFLFDGTNGPYNEEAIPNPVNFYAESKLKSEEVIINSSIDWAIARTILVYGITEGMSRSNLVLFVKGKLEAGENIQIVDDQWRNPTLAEDLAQGCFLIAEKKAKGIFNIAGGDEGLLTPYDMAVQTADFFKLDKSLITKTDGSQFKQTAKRPPKTGLTLDKSRELLGYNPKKFVEGLAVLDKQI